MNGPPRTIEMGARMGLDNPLHIAFLVLILLLVFGAKRLPEVGRSLGGGMREFKESVTGEATVPVAPMVSGPAKAMSAPAEAPQRQADSGELGG
jgi:sec-independent protein translocase protein TatA